MKPRILVTPRSLTAERHPYVEELSRRGFERHLLHARRDSQRRRIARAGARLRRLVGGGGAGDVRREAQKAAQMLVPVEGLEPPTHGLQNPSQRCPLLSFLLAQSLWFSFRLNRL
jgi:hypothetical protein